MMVSPLSPPLIRPWRAMQADCEDAVRFGAGALADALEAVA